MKGIAFPGQVVFRKRRYRGNYQFKNVDLSGLNLRPNEYVGVQRMSNMEVLIYASCDRQNMSQDLRNAFDNKSFDIKTNVPMMIGGSGNEIFLRTFQNGINNNIEDFVAMGRKMVDSSPTGMAVLGIYNPSRGVMEDVKRCMHEKRGNPTYGTRSLEAVFNTLFDMKDNMGLTGYIWHNPHSEAGAVFNSCYKNMSSTNKGRMRNNVIVTAYGPAQCIPKAHAIDAKKYLFNPRFCNWMVCKKVRA